MTTVVELESPADRLGVSETFERLPTFEFQIAGMIGASPPLVWVSGPDRHAVEAALEADPTVDVIASLADASDDRWLFRLEFGPELEEFHEIVSENNGAVLEAAAQDGTWSLKLLFHDRDSLSAAHSVFEDREFQVSIKRVTSLDDPSGGTSPLTSTQYETIVKANELGYFDVPRKVTLQELASELDISHQALSERLRRSHAALVSEELSNRMTPTGIDS
ncbi:helix-turn-helix domain-containing protein [Natrononativus amylolyticus]|uniref:helix-turn-helix domain-containing protein n=1 Tax=Natrononativus amylolyticus TaxID=2963434 RepID=UPI0020CF7ED6|nr:helix-turn-helix domain-containing protein [Natrononativus amylolyticus]